MKCPDCPTLYDGREDPRSSVRETCCIDELAEHAPKNTMLNDVATPEQAPLNRKARRRAEKLGRKR